MQLDDRLLAELPRATVLSRAPGRVNLMGEHTDYNGFPVLPLAIDRHIAIAAAPCAEPVVRIRSTEAARYGPEDVPIAELSTRPRRGTWCDYVVAAARCRVPAAGVELLVAGDLPAEAGLSSSSALVVASLLALGEEGDRCTLAEEARLAERYVGTLSGGMDQAISLLARRGNALRIDFRPLRTQAVSIPPHIAVVVANSGVAAPKSGTAREGYNRRVTQCLEAARELGAPAGGLLADVSGSDRAGRAAALADAVLRRRATFVFQEAMRVDEAVTALRAGDLARLGALLDASHRGLRDLYEVSHPAVDALVERAVDFGAAGARIVGAGFGGCMVAVCTRDRVPEILDGLGVDAWAFEAAGPATRTLL